MPTESTYNWRFPDFGMKIVEWLETYDNYDDYVMDRPYKVCYRCDTDLSNDYTTNSIRFTTYDATARNTLLYWNKIIMP